MILRGEVEDVQLGAFLMLMRVKEESPDELAGFVEAVREQAQVPAALKVDIDWSSYAGKRKHAPWFFFSLLLLANSGLRIFVHGAEGHTPERVYLTEVMAQFGFGLAHDWDTVSDHLDRQSVAYMPLADVAPRLAEMIELRPILGLRSPVHSLSRLINPLSAPLVIQGIFHPPYAGLHQAAGELLDYSRVAVIRGEGGEIERNPDNMLKVFRARATANGHIQEEDRWEPLYNQSHSKPDTIDPKDMLHVWQGRREDEYGISAAVSTAALALFEAAKAESHQQALDMGWQLWEQRDKGRFDEAPIASV
jgi:anthranilate phosphoribosyltransferase